MRRVVVDMQNVLFADAIKQALTKFDSDFEVLAAETPEQTEQLCVLVQPYALLMEVTSYRPWRLEERMTICSKIKSQIPNCKVVMVVDENAEQNLASLVRQAKKDGLIDQFIYGSVSATYLSAVIDTL